ncbi:hypothetical protein CR513_47860, partial [Mucuna pruriens]
MKHIYKLDINYLLINPHSTLNIIVVLYYQASSTIKAGDYIRYVEEFRSSYDYFLDVKWPT